MQNLRLIYEDGNSALIQLIKESLESSGKLRVNIEKEIPLNTRQKRVLGNFVYDKNKHFLYWKNEAPVYLTILENNVFSLLLKNAGKVVKREDILKSFWPDVSYYSSRSLDIIICKLRKILHKDSSVRIETFRGLGFSLDF